MSRFVVSIACVAAVLAAVCNGAHAAASPYAPRLVVDPSSVAAGASGAVTVSMVQPASDLSTARATIYAPAGTTAARPAVGVTVGTANAAALTEPATGTPLALLGRLTAADPTQYQTSACAPGLHDQVWLLALAGSGRTLTVPIFVDPVSGPDAALGALRLDACFDPPAAAGSPAILGLDLHLGAGMLHGPARAGELVWRSFFTPFQAGATAPDPTATVESRALLRQPLRLTLLGALGKRGRVTLFGSFQGGGRRLARVAVTLLAGATPRRQRAVSSTRTGSAGGYSFAVKLKKTTFFRTRVTVPARDVTSTACRAPSTAPAGCVTATSQPFHLLSGTAVKVLVR